MKIISIKKLEEYLDKKRLGANDHKSNATEIEGKRSAARKFLDFKFLNRGPSKHIVKDDMPVY
jgi:hypothetical protein